MDTCAALNRNLDLNIKEFMIFNWGAVADMVDTLGGIEVDVKSNTRHGRLPDILPDGQATTRTPC